MSLIDYTYFINDVNIPHSSSDDITVLTNAISRWEPECLKLLLGDKLYAAFIAGLADGSPAQKWLDLRDGGVAFDVTVGGETITKTWDGLRGSGKKSLIAFYVYYQYRVANESYFTGIRQSAGKSELSQSVDFNPVIVDIWNKFVEMYGEFPYLSRETAYAPTANSFYYDVVSAFNFLMANISDYPDWRFTPLSMRNQFEI